MSVGKPLRLSQILWKRLNAFSSINLIAVDVAFVLFLGFVYGAAGNKRLSLFIDDLHVTKGTNTGVPPVNEVSFLFD